MFVNKVETLKIARAMAAHAATRQGLLSTNIANADTPNYQRQDIKPFAEVWRDDFISMRKSRPGHLGLDSQLEQASFTERNSLNPNGNGVSLEDEMLRSAQAKQTHELALAIQRSLSGSIRSALGRK